MNSIVLIITSILFWQACCAQEQAEMSNLDDMTLFQVYQENRNQGIPNYITIDLWLLTYSLLRQRSLEYDERVKFAPILAVIVERLRLSMKAEDNDDPGRANRDFMDVLATLLSGQVTVLMSMRAKEELNLVLKAMVVAESPLWQVPINYSQFQPQGRYTRPPENQRYFRAMRYAESVLFYLKASKATGVTEKESNRFLIQLIRLARIIRKDSQLKSAIDEFDRGLGWRLGKPDDLTLTDIINSLNSVEGENISSIRQQLLRAVAIKERKPRIVNAVVDTSKLFKGESVTDVLVGVRLLPLRHTAESEAFQLLLYPNTGPFMGQLREVMPFGLNQSDSQSVKTFPTAYELAAMLVEHDDKQILSQWQENQFEHYSTAQSRAKVALSSATGLNALHLELIKIGLEQSTPPSRFATMLAFWTYQRYIDQLYQKQSYSPVGKGIERSLVRPGARIEVATMLYKQLETLVKEQINHSTFPEWNILHSLLGKAIELSKKIERGEKMNSEEEAFMNHLDKDLLALSGSSGYPVIVNIHTELASGLVVEEGVGYADINTHNLARGARLTHYEFKYPIQKQMSDKAWRKLLRSGEAHIYKTFPLLSQ